MKKLQSRKPRKKGIGKDSKRRSFHCAPPTLVPKNDQEAYKSLASLIILTVFKRKKVIGERQTRPLQYQTWVRNPDTKRPERHMRILAEL